MACPIVPLALVDHPPDGTELATMTLRADGTLIDMGQSMRLDTHGCLRGPDGTLGIDASDPNRIWTPYFDLVTGPRGRLTMGPGYSLTIGPDGGVYRRRAIDSGAVPTLKRVRSDAGPRQAMKCLATGEEASEDRGSAIAE